MEIEFSSHFLKRAKRLSAKEKQILEDKIEIFRKDFGDPRLKIHALTGRLGGSFSFSITNSKRVVFVIVGQRIAVFADVGSHDEVY